MNDLNDADNALLDRAREGHEPTGADRSRVRAAIAAQLGLSAGLVATSAGAGAGAVVATSTSLVAVAAKVLLATAIVGGLTGGATLVYRSSRPATVVAPVVASPAPHEAQVNPATEATLGPVPSMAATPASSGMLAPVDPQAPSVARPVPVRRSMEVASPPANATPGASPNADRAQSQPSLEASPAQAAVAPGSAPTPELPSPAPAQATMPPLPPTTLEAETRLIGAGVAALHAGDAARALTLLDEHARQFPDGVLAQERTVERIAALCALGRQDEAQSAAAAFLRAHGGSPLVERVRASCGGRGSIR